MRLKTKLFGKVYQFKNVNEVMAKANELKSGDVLAGIAASSEQERVAAKEVLSQLTVADISASDVPQPENSPPNAIDGNLDTRWSATGIADLTVDLGSVKAVQAFGIAVYQDTTIDGRRQFFEVQVSEDGENYTTVFDGETSGTTLEEEMFEITRSKARYIRFRCKETSVGEWNSITELSIYGQ